MLSEVQCFEGYFVSFRIYPFPIIYQTSLHADESSSRTLPGYVQLSNAPNCWTWIIRHVCLDFGRQRSFISFSGYLYASASCRIDLYLFKVSWKYWHISVFQLLLGALDRSHLYVNELTYKVNFKWLVFRLLTIKTVCIYFSNSIYINYNVV